MTNPVVEARARAQAALARWREARAAVNNPASVPHRLDAIVAVAERAIAVIGQDIVTEVEAIVVELAALRFQVEFDEALSRPGERHASRSMEGWAACRAPRLGPALPKARTISACRPACACQHRTSQNN